MLKFGIDNSHPEPTHWQTLCQSIRFAARIKSAVAMVAAILMTQSDGRAAAADPETPAATSANPVSFERDVLPLLKSHCWSCHSAEKQESGLRLDRRDAMLQGGDQGPAVKPGDSAASRLIHYVAATDADKVMPPDGDRLPEAAVAILRNWIDQGCEWPEALQAKDGRRDHWAYQPLRRVALPEVNSDDRFPIRNPIDQFVLQKLHEQQLTPSPEADRTTLIRRLYLDLLGLPPAVEDVDAFLADERANAYELLVDRLLASSHFGERWGRHWLDMARYADSDGFEKDNPRPDAFLWRDWVINAINADMPFDQFTIEQLAGDLLPGASFQQQLATAFHRQTLTNTEGGTDKEQWRIEACFDRTETTGAVWMGLTVGCARCHTHKYDAISQREYYQLFAMYNNGDEQTFVMPKSREEIAAYEVAKPKHEAAVAELTAKLQAEQQKLQSEYETWLQKSRSQIAAAIAGQAVPPADPPIPDKIRRILEIPPTELNDDQRQQLLEHFSTLQPATADLVKSLQDLKKNAPAKPEWTVRSIAQRMKEPRQTFVLRRGEFLEPLKETVILSGGFATLPPLKSRQEGTAADRLDLARWLVSPDHPLTPRVTVNHLWRQLFGAGIVRTANDFGVRGDPPTHPELLDWLASEFIGRRGETDNVYVVVPWSRKALIRLIVTSATWRQASRHRPELREADPTNQWLARQNRLRVEAEIVRDLSLSAAGILSDRVGGPSVFPPLPPGIAELSYANNFKWQASEGADRYRRGMYTFFKRTAPHPNLTMFDCPDANLTCTERRTSNTPLQALTVLNNEIFVDTSRAFAKRLLLSEMETDHDRLAFGLRLCVSRKPTDSEIQSLLELLAKSRDWYQKNPEDAVQLAAGSSAPEISAAENAAWIATSRILLNLDEMITRE
jgi:hypothetical protein